MTSRQAGELNQSDLNRALELYRQGKVDQAANLLEIKDEPTKPIKAKSKPTKPVKPNPPMVLDTVEPDSQIDIDLKNALVVSPPTVPDFFPNQFQLPKSNQTQSAKPKPNKTPTKSKPVSDPKTTEPIEEKVIGRDLPAKIEESMMKWLQIDTDLDKLRQIKRDLDKQKAELETEIKNFMEKYEIPEIGPNEEIGLEFQVREVKQGFSKKLVTETLNRIFTQSQREKFLAELESQRTVVEKTRLKLNKPKKPRK